MPYKAEIKGKSVYYLKVNKSNLTKLFFLFRFTLYAAHNRLTGETWERSVKNSRFIVSAEYVFFSYSLYFFFNHAVSCTLQGRQMEPSVKTLRSPLFAEFWRYYVSSGRTQKKYTVCHHTKYCACIVI